MEWTIATLSIEQHCSGQHTNMNESDVAFEELEVAGHYVIWRTKIEQ